MESELSDSEKDIEVVDKTKKEKKIKKKVKGKKSKSKVAKDMIMNERGELVPIKEYTLEKAYCVH